MPTRGRPTTVDRTIIEDSSSGLLVIPPEPGQDIGFASWSKDWRAMRRLVLDTLESGTAPTWQVIGGDPDDRQLVIPVLLELYPRPDNEYNQRAVSLLNPNQASGSVLDRHLGYMYESHLYHHGEAIDELVNRTRRRVGCRAWISLDDFEAVGDERFLARGQSRWAPSREFMTEEYVREGVESELADAPDSEVNLSEENRFTASELRCLGYQVAHDLRISLTRQPATIEVVRDYVRQSCEAATPAETAKTREATIRSAWNARLLDSAKSVLAIRESGGQWRRETERDRLRAQRHGQAQADVSAWAAWELQPVDAILLKAVTRQVYDATRHVVVNDRGAELGQVRDGVLTLVDERLRPKALEALSNHGISLPRPETPLQGFANATLLPTRGGWYIAKVEPAVKSTRLVDIGWYDTTTDECVVFADPYVEPVRRLLLRTGVPVARVGRATPEDLFGDRVAYNTEPAQLVSQFRARPKFLPDVRRLLPVNQTQWLNASWTAQGGDGGLFSHAQLESDEATVRTFRHWHRSPSEQALVRGACRLCAQKALHPAGSPAYCLSCVSLASRGVLVDTGQDGPWMDAVAWALRQLSVREFSGPPSLGQLAHAPAGEAQDDTLVLLRMLIPRYQDLPALHQRKALSWSEWLAYADLLGAGVRTARGTKTRATDGHLCRSLMERHVDDFFHRWGIWHEVEPAYPYHPRLNASGLRADWRLSDGTLVEAFGLEDDPQYALKIERKRALAAESGLEIVEVRVADLANLRDIFSPWLHKQVAQ